MSAGSLRVSLDRDSLVYRPGETITGKVTLANLTNTQHAGLRVAVKGSLHLLPTKDQGRPEQKIQLLSKVKELLPAGKILGHTELDFSLQLIPESGFELYETYHGKHVAVEYLVKTELTRTGLQKALRGAVDFILQRPANGESAGDLAERPFRIEDIGGVSDSLIRGQIQSPVVDIGRPLFGEIEIVKAPTIECVELHVVRNEKITTPEFSLESSSDAQCCELVSGNVERNLKIPIYCLLQKFVVAPSLETSKFSVSYVLRIAVKHKDPSSNSREHYHDIPVTVQRNG